MRSFKVGGPAALQSEPKQAPVTVRRETVPSVKTENRFEGAPLSASYTVQKGDSLFLIAKEQFGDGRKWKDIYELNKSVIGSDPNKLRTGIKLKMPGAAAPKSSAPAKGGAVKTTPNTTTANKATGAASAQPHPNLGLLSPQMLSVLKKAGVDAPNKFLDFLEKVGHLDTQKAAGLLKHLDKTGSTLEVMKNLADAYVAGQKGDMAEAVACGFDACATLMESGTPEVVKSFAQGLCKPLLKGGRTKALTETLLQVTGSEAMTALGSLARGDSGGFARHLGSVVERIGKDSGLLAKVAPKLTSALMKMLPEKTAAKLVAKSAGRKIPILGTVVVGAMDMANVVKNPTDWKNWASLGSTAVGMLPGVGTAASVVIDLGVLVSDVASTVPDARKELQSAFRS